MRHTLLKCSAVTYYVIFAAVIALTGVYLKSALNIFLAFTAYQQFQRISKLTDDPASAPERQHALTTAMVRNPEHGDYYAAFGSVLSEYTDNETKRIETYLQEAVRRDPANADYYYEAGRISAERQACSPSPALSPDDAAEACSAARYFLAALRNAPNDLFFRTQIATWLDYYHHDLAVRTMRRLFERDRSLFTGYSGQYAPIFGKALFQLGMDWESEDVLRLMNTASTTCPIPPLSANDAEFEIAYDDGVAEWMTMLRTSSDRVKKVLHLPESSGQFQAGTLRILMNMSREPNAECVLRLQLDEMMQTIPCAEIRMVPTWHEFAIDPAWLHGKASVMVSLRVFGIEQADNALEIWGDQQAATCFSEFSFRQKTDLSPSEGKQQGEYLIRLRLLRSQPNQS